MTLINTWRVFRFAYSRSCMSLRIFFPGKLSDDASSCIQASAAGAASIGPGCIFLASKTCICDLGSEVQRQKKTKSSTRQARFNRFSVLRLEGGNFEKVGNLLVSVYLIASGSRAFGYLTPIQFPRPNQARDRNITTR